MTDQQGKDDRRKVNTSMRAQTIWRSILWLRKIQIDVEIVQKQEENKYAHEGFSSTVSDVYIMCQIIRKGVNEQSWFMKRLSALFGDSDEGTSDRDSFMCDRCGVQRIRRSERNMIWK